MAVNRRDFVALASGLVGAWACSGAGAGLTLATTRDGLLHSQPGKPESRTVLVFMPETPHTRAAWTGLSDELGGEFSLVAVRVESREQSPMIDAAIKRYQPSVVVLMNNPTVAAYRRYLTQHEALRGIPAVVLMTSFLDAPQLAELGATGITYEVPLITAVTNLRSILASPIDSVGIVCRDPLVPFLRDQRALAVREQIRVNAVQVDADPNVSEVKRAIRLLKMNSHAMWLLNDDRLLTPQLIADAWLPGLNEKPWRPTIVGAASLVSVTTSFGTFAVLPDHTELGAQVAGLIFEIADNGWSLPESHAALPLSTTTTIDLAQVRERFSLREDALAQVDRVLE